MPEHLLYALIDQDGGLISSLFDKMGIDVNTFLGALGAKLENVPRVTGSGREPGKIYISPECDRVLVTAEKSAASMGDDYVSVEHLFLALMEKPTATLLPLKDIFGIKKEEFLRRLRRSRQGAEPDNPEDAQRTHSQSMALTSWRRRGSRNSTL